MDHRVRFLYNSTRKLHPEVLKSEKRCKLNESNVPEIVCVEGPT
jgi:hypothetical protein